MFLLYYFRPSRGFHIRLKAHAPASSSATTMVCRLGDDILHPVIGFLRFWTCLKAFYVFLFSDRFISFWYGVFFLYGFIQIYSRIVLKTLEFIRKRNLSFLGDLACQSFKECIFLESDFSAFLIYEILRYIFWRSGLYFSLFLPFKKTHGREPF